MEYQAQERSELMQNLVVGLMYVSALALALALEKRKQERNYFRTMRMRQSACHGEIQEDIKEILCSQTSLNQSLELSHSFTQPTLQLPFKRCHPQHCSTGGSHSVGVGTEGIQKHHFKKSVRGAETLMI